MAHHRNSTMDPNSSLYLCLTLPNSLCNDQVPTGEPSSLWYVGVLLSIVSSVSSNFGLNTQKYSMIQEIRHGRERSYTRQPIWMLGLLMVILGAFADFAALGFAAASLITPVGGLTMVANLFFASWWLGERISRLDLGSTALIVLGIVLVAAFADKSSQCFDLASLLCLYTRVEFIVYAVFMTLGLMAMYACIVVVRKRVKTLRDEGLTGDRAYSRYKRIYPLLCAGMSGIVGAQSVLFAKSAVEIVKSAMRGGDEFKQFATYVILALMFAAIFGQIHWIAVGLQEFDAVVMVPVFQCVFVVFTIIGGAAYFGEFESFTRIQIIMFPVGVAILIIGVMGLAMHKSRTAEELLLSGGGDDAVGPEDLESHSPGPASPGDKKGAAADPAAREHAASGAGGAGSAAARDSAERRTSRSSFGTGIGTTLSNNSSRSTERRRLSVNRLAEFNRMAPAGAPHFQPAVMFWGEITDDFASPNSPLFNEGAQGEGAGAAGAGAPARRSSMPAHQRSSRSLDVEAGTSEAAPSAATTTTAAAARLSSQQRAAAAGGSPAKDIFAIDLDDEQARRGTRGSKALSFAGVEHMLKTSRRDAKGERSGKLGHHDSSDDDSSDLKLPGLPSMPEKSAESPLSAAAAAAPAPKGSGKTNL
jgi:drug/metabolite transporter (DMT)-like permease